MHWLASRQDHTFAKHYEKWIDWYWKTIAPTKLELKLLSNKSRIETTIKKKTYPRRKIKFWSDSKAFTATTWETGNYLTMIISNQKPHYLVEIHDKTLAYNMAELFKGIWNKVK